MATAPIASHLCNTCVRCVDLTTDTDKAGLFWLTNSRPRVVNLHPRGVNSRIDIEEVRLSWRGHHRAVCGGGLSSQADGNASSDRLCHGDP
eukprot:656177-Prorocentrum_minimum.AAC.1